MACSGGEAFWRYRLGGADIGFDSDFFGHGRLRLKNGLAHDFKLPRAGAVVRAESRAGAVVHQHCFYPPDKAQTAGDIHVSR